ncbi:MAG TPA: type II toxin-antitoxin system VapC family toxin [Bdellovibrionota bacterium]|nr:type II toxin-antitoxin system VapC family toxin [Bdellovibrionota bacterium]
MNLLLDTHVLLWWLNDDPQLSARARELIGNSKNISAVSAATIWEIWIKERLKKIQLPRNFREVLEAQSFQDLPITSEHAHAMHFLPPHHRDPFDRMLIVQSQVEGLTLVTHDARIQQYDVEAVVV